MWSLVSEDVGMVFERDPAARNRLEVLLCYPGLHAVWTHRLAHFLHRRQFYVLARLIAHLALIITGIDIHPGAVIGRRVFIDHGQGVVIGETANVGCDVTLYQGVTLGGTGKEKGKRHPTVGDRVVIGAGACVLGSITVGDDSRVGANAVVIESVPSGCTVVGVPGRIVVRHGHRVEPLAHGELPDPVQDALETLDRRLANLEAGVSSNTCRVTSRRS